MLVMVGGICGGEKQKRRSLKYILLQYTMVLRLSSLLSTTSSSTMARIIDVPVLSKADYSRMPFLLR